MSNGLDKNGAGSVGGSTGQNELAQPVWDPSDLAQYDALPVTYSRWTNYSRLFRPSTVVRTFQSRYLVLALPCPVCGTKPLACV